MTEQTSPTGVDLDLIADIKRVVLTAKKSGNWLTSEQQSATADTAPAAFANSTN